MAAEGRQKVYCWVAYCRDEARVAVYLCTGQQVTASAKALEVLLVQAPGWMLMQHWREEN